MRASLTVCAVPSCWAQSWTRYFSSGYVRENGLSDSTRYLNEIQKVIRTVLLLIIACLVGMITALASAWAARKDGRRWSLTITCAGGTFVAGTGIMIAIFTFLGLNL
jgi:hypothetical protein